MYKHTFTHIHPYTYKYTYICTYTCIYVSEEGEDSLGLSEGVGDDCDTPIIDMDETPKSRKRKEPSTNRKLEEAELALLQVMSAKYSDGQARDAEDEDSAFIPTCVR